MVTPAQSMGLGGLVFGERGEGRGGGKGGGLRLRRRRRGRRGWGLRSCWGGGEECEYIYT